LTDKLSAFFRINASAIESRLPGVLEELQAYRESMRKEVVEKERALSYGFLRDVYGTWEGKEETAEALEWTEQDGDGRLRRLVKERDEVFVGIQERVNAIRRSPSACLWYLFWVRFFPYMPTSLPAR
jgi:hypothetical protein